MNLTEVDMRIVKTSEDILWAVKVNTLVTGVGIVGVGLAMLGLIVQSSWYHESIMRRLPDTGVNQHVNIERPRTREEIIEDGMRRNEVANKKGD